VSEWQTTAPADLIAALRPGGWLVGKSGIWPKQIRLHKTDMVADLRKMEADSRVTWCVRGNPDETGHHAGNRRTIVLWLGK
jgi:hypothetical protein